MKITPRGLPKSSDHNAAPIFLSASRIALTSLSAFASIASLLTSLCFPDPPAKLLLYAMLSGRPSNSSSSSEFSPTRSGLRPPPAAHAQLYSTETAGCSCQRCPIPFSLRRRLRMRACPNQRAIYRSPCMALPTAISHRRLIWRARGRGQLLTRVPRCRTMRRR